MEFIDQTEMVKLMQYLTTKKIDFICRSFLNGLQVVVPNNWDAICHDGSYGHECGLLEVMGLPQCNDDIIGYLTAQKLIEMLEENAE